MTTIKSFIERLSKIGINVELISNYPWIYLDKVNGNKVKEKFQGNHGFTVFFLTKDGVKITDISIIFNLIRKLR